MPHPLLAIRRISLSRFHHPLSTDGGEFCEQNFRKGGYRDKVYLVDAELVPAVTGAKLRGVLEEIGRSHDVRELHFLETAM
jgi:hypothetical protein